MSIFSEPEPSAYGPGKSYHLVTTEQLEQLIIDMSPEIRHDTNRMSDMIREMVDLERTKSGLDNPKGTLTLWPNKKKASENQPDMLGAGVVQGRKYEAAAWFHGDDNVRISILPAPRK